MTIKVAKDVLNARFHAFYWANRVAIHQTIVQIANGGGDIPANRRNAAVQALRRFRRGKLPASVAEMVVGGKMVLYEDVLNGLLKRVVAEQHEGRIALYFFDVSVQAAATAAEQEGGEATDHHYRVTAGYFLYPEALGVPDGFDPNGVAPVVAIRTDAKIDALVDVRIAALVRVPVLGPKRAGELEQGDAVLCANITAVREGRRWEQGCGRNAVLFTTADEWAASTQYADQLVGVKSKDRKVLTVEIDGLKTDLHIHIDQVHEAVLADPEQVAKRYGYPSVKVWHTRLRRIAEANERRLERDAIKQAIVDAMMSSATDIRFEPFPDYWAARHIEQLRANGFIGNDATLASEVSRMFHETVLLREFGRRVGVVEPDGGVDAALDWAVENLTIERVTTESNRALANTAVDGG